MTTFLADGTLDPRTQHRESPDITGIPWVVPGEVMREEPIARSDPDDLAGRVEVLMERAVKWTTQIRDLGEEAYILQEPIQIVVEEYRDESVVARFPEVEAFGEGHSEPEALANLKLAILDLYDELAEAKAPTLGREPRAWWRVLGRLISVA